MPLVELQHASVGLNLDLDRREERQPARVDGRLHGRGLVRLYIGRSLNRAAGTFERHGVAAWKEVVQHQRRDAALSPIDCNGRSFRGRRDAQTSRLPCRARLLSMSRYSRAGPRRWPSSGRRVLSGVAVNHSARRVRPVAVVTANTSSSAAPTDRRHLGGGTRWRRTRGYSSLRPESLARIARAAAGTASSSAPTQLTTSGATFAGAGRGVFGLGLETLAMIARAAAGAAATASSSAALTDRSHPVATIAGARRAGVRV